MCVDAQGLTCVKDNVVSEVASSLQRHIAVGAQRAFGGVVALQAQIQVASALHLACADQAVGLQVQVLFGQDAAVGVGESQFGRDGRGCNA